MGRLSRTQSDRAALRRDFVWVLLWGLRNEGWEHRGWVSSRAVYEAWLDGRSECGIALADDYVGGPATFTADLNRLVDDGRAKVSRAKGRHPRYRAIGG